MPAKASRAAFGEAILELGAQDPRIVIVDADLRKSTMTSAFAKAYPGRAFNVGIAEANMIGIGAGLALAGKIPFICSFACFVSLSSAGWMIGMLGSARRQAMSSRPIWL